MLINDNVYGQAKLNEPVLIEVLLSEPLQRLKRIAQYGIPQQFFNVNGFSRYDHSVGVMLLLRKLGASLEEQLAGLTHDLSHTAFSHVTDRIFGDPFNGHPQDERHHSFLLSSEVSDILKKHGFDPARIAEIESHPILEREIPDLCADRIDYSLREFYFTAVNGTIASYLESLVVVGDKVVFDNQTLAENFATQYLLTHSAKWASAEKTVKQYLFAELLKAALATEVISINDLFKDDAFVMKKLLASKEPSIVAAFERLKKDIDLNTNKEKFLTLQRRQRYIDPEFIKNGKILRLSGVSEQYRSLLALQTKIHSKPLRVSLRPPAIR